MDMKILYIHGWTSELNEDTELVSHLKTIGDVCELTFDYTLPCTKIYEVLANFILTNHLNIIVGSGLGGFWANFVGDKFGVPFVAINPIISPKISLKKHIGNGINNISKEYYLSKMVVDNYYDFQTKGCGLILLDESGNTDDKIDYSRYAIEMRNFQVETVSSKEHCFQNIKELLPLIAEQYYRSELVCGLN